MFRLRPLQLNLHVEWLLAPNKAALLTPNIRLGERHVQALCRVQCIDVRVHVARYDPNRIRRGTRSDQLDRVLWPRNGMSNQQYARQSLKRSRPIDQDWGTCVGYYRTKKHPVIVENQLDSIDHVSKQRQGWRC
jgi:hypothetical protein